MTRKKTTNIKLAQQGRIDKVLDTYVNINGVVITWRNWLSDQREISREKTDGMIKWSRLRANQMSEAELIAYEARLKSHTLYWVNNILVHKIVYDTAVSTTENQ